MAKKGAELNATIKIGGTMDPSVKRSISAAGANIKKLGSGIVSIGKTAAVAGAAMAAAFTGAAVAAGKALYDLGEEFKQASNTIRLGTGATGDALKDLDGTARRIYSSMSVKMNETAAVVADLNTLLGVSGEQNENLAKTYLQLAAITGKEASSIYNPMSRAFNAWGVEAGKQQQYLDFTWRAVQDNGIAYDTLASSLQANASAFRGLGYSMEQAIALQAKWDKAGVDSAAILTAQKAAMKNMAADGVKDLAKGYSIAIKKIKAAKTEAEAQTLAMELYGKKAGVTMAQYIREGVVDVDEEVARISARTEETIEAAYKDTRTFSDAWQTFGNKMRLALAPMAESVFEQVQKFIPILEKIATKTIPYLQYAVSRFTAKLGEWTEHFRLWAESITREDVKRWVASWQNRFAKLKVAVLPVLDAIRASIGWAIDNRDMLLSVGKAVAVFIAGAVGVVKLVGAFSAVKAAIVSLVPVITFLATNPIGWVVLGITAIIAAVAALYVYWDDITSWMSKRWRDFSKAFPHTAAELVSTWKTVCRTVTFIFNYAVDSIIGSAQVIWEAVKAVGGLIYNSISGIVKAVINIVEGMFALFTGDFKGFYIAFSEAGQTLISTAVENFGVICNFVTNVWSIIGDTFKKTWSDIADFFAPLVEWFGEIGEKICSAFGSAWDQLKSKVKSVIDAIASFLQPIIEKIQWLADKLGGVVDTIKDSSWNPTNWFASGGFTNGPSICGEAGTEAVISFDPAYRKQNQGYLMTAAEMLGMTAEPKESHSAVTYNLGGVTFAPVIKAESSASNTSLMQQLRSCMPEFLDAIERALEERRSHAY